MSFNTNKHKGSNLGFNSSVLTNKELRPEVLNYITAAGITNSQEINAVNIFINSLISDEIYTLLYTLGLFSPTSLAAALVDAINPSVNDLTVVNSVDFDVNGVETNGSDSYLITGFDLSVPSATIGNFGTTIYQKTAGEQSGITAGFALPPIRYYTVNDGGFVAATFPSSISTAAAVELQVLTFTKNATHQRIYANGVSILSSADATTTALTSDLAYLGAANLGGSGAGFEQRRFATYIQHQDLTDAQVLTLRNRIVTYNQSLPTPR